MSGRPWNVLRISRTGKLNSGNNPPPQTIPHHQGPSPVAVDVVDPPCSSGRPCQTTQSPDAHFPHNTCVNELHSISPSADPLAIARMLKKEEELARREAELHRREQVLIMAGHSAKRKNWPRCTPILYHDVNTEIPAGFKGMVKTAYITWCITIGGFLLNWAVVSAMLFANFPSVDLMDWTLATFSAGAGIPLSFKMWYRRLYKNARDGERVDSLLWIFHMSFAIAWAVWTFVSLPKFGDMGAGLFPMLQAFRARNTVFGLACFLNMVVWCLAAIFSLYVLRRARKLGLQHFSPPAANYRASSGSGGGGGGRRSVINQLRASFMSNSFFARPSAPALAPDVTPTSHAIPPVHSVGP